MATTKLTLPIEFLNECFHCNPETGELTWKERPREHFNREHVWIRTNNLLAGKPAGTIQKQGYYIVKICGKLYRNQRIIWAMAYGEWPEYFIDHINGDRTGNRITNLRQATPRENSLNRIA